MVHALSLGFLELLGLLAVMGAVFRLGHLARRHPQWLLGAYSLVLVTLPKTGQAESLVSVLGLNVLVVDPILLVMIAGAVFGSSTLLERLKGFNVRSMSFVALVLAYALVGLGLHGKASLNEARGMLFMLGFVAFLLSLPKDRDLIHVVRSWLYWTAFGLCVAASVRAAQSGLGNANDVVLLADGTTIATRVLTAQQALVVAAAALLSIADALRVSGALPLARTVLYLVVVVVAQTRSVWLASVAGVLLLFIRGVPKRRLPAIAVSTLIIGPFVAVALILTSVGGEVANAVSTSFASASATTGTGGARIDDNRQLIQRARSQGADVVLFGTTYGAPFVRTENGRLVTFQPHDGYVQTFLEMGLVGLGLVLSILLPLWRRAWRARSIWLGLATLFLVFSISYGFPEDLAPVVAVLFTLGGPDGGGRNFQSADASALEHQNRTPSLR